MTTITRLFEFDYGHRVLGHEGKCRYLHGHRGRAEVTVEAPELDSIGRVIDFGEIKKLIGGWIDSTWDHQLLLNKDDPQLLHLQATEERAPYVMSNGNPTAENMAQELFQQCQCLFHGSNIKPTRVRIWETPSCCADYQ